MSVSSSLLLFLLCLSLHACNARHLRAVDKKLGTKIHLSIKNDDKIGSDQISALSNVKSSSSKQHGVAKRESIAGTLSNDKTQKLNETMTNQKIPKGESKTSGAVQTESLVSVSWPVPHRKRSEKTPGFYSDYMQPRTHPPSHN